MHSITWNTKLREYSETINDIVYGPKNQAIIIYY